MKLWNYIKSKMLLHLKQTVCENSAEMTYEEIIIFSEEFSKRLTEIKCCAILCKSEMAAGIAILSCFAADITAVPLSHRYGEAHCKKILMTISPDAIITDQGGELNVIYIKESLFAKQEVHPSVIMTTSGTTGIPKGVMLTDTNIITNISDIVQYFDINSTDSILITRPLYHCAALTGEFLTSLVKGVKIYFYSGEFNPLTILNLLDKFSITTFCSTPTVVKILTHFKKIFNKNSLKHICISGENMDRPTGISIADAFPNAEIYHVYGLTEASPRVCYLPPNMFREYSDCVGVPLPSVSVKILTRDGKTVSKNETGVLWIKGDNIMSGYYNDPLRTSEVIKGDWLCTGDLAILTDCGLIKIKGRVDDLIIKSGVNIYPQDIESSLKEDVRVREVFVCGYDDEKYGKQIQLNISGDFSDVLEIQKLCLDRLPSFQRPLKINLVKELSKNSSGKIIRRCNYD